MTQEQLQALRRQVMEKEFSRMNPMQRVLCLPQRVLC